MPQGIDALLSAEKKKLLHTGAAFFYEIILSVSLLNFTSTTKVIVNLRM
jgi:hypothetical protein